VYAPQKVENEKLSSEYAEFIGNKSYERIPCHGMIFDRLFKHSYLPRKNDRSGYGKLFQRRFKPSSVNLVR